MAQKLYDLAIQLQGKLDGSPVGGTESRTDSAIAAWQRRHDRAKPSVKPRF